MTADHGSDVLIVNVSTGGDAIGNVRLESIGLTNQVDWRASYPGVQSCVVEGSDGGVERSPSGEVKVHTIKSSQ